MTQFKNGCKHIFNPKFFQNSEILASCCARPGSQWKNSWRLNARTHSHGNMVRILQHLR